MRIAQISTLSTPVRREGSGSVEALIWLLARELTRLGHEVTVFAAAGSDPPCSLEAPLPGVYGRRGSPSDWAACEWFNLTAAVEQSARFDVMHSHAYLYGLALERLSQAPMVHTYHLQPSEDTASVRALAPGACVTAISRSQWREYPECETAAVVHHGLDAEQFTFQRQPEDYICYLGRFTEGKGVEEAIRAARTLDVRLLLAGPENGYFQRNVKPLIDGHTVQYVGPVTGAARDRFLGGARALLYPLSRPEPFGLVQVEAMLCGTPVAAIGIGAVPEVVDPGVTGYYSPSEEAFPEQVLRCFELDRKRVRQRAELRFGSARMAREYAQVYEQVVTAPSMGRSLQVA